MRNIIWFRRDLRINDNRALYAACENGGEVNAVYMVTPQQWQQHNESAAKLAFWHACLQKLEADLATLGIGLRVLTAPSFSEVPQALLQLAKSSGATGLYFNNEYEYNESVRDDAVCTDFAAAGIKTCRFDDRVLLPPGSVLTGSSSYYTVFTPFMKAWLKKAAGTDLSPLPAPKPQPRPLTAALVADKPASVAWCCDSVWRSDLWPAGEKAAQQMLQKFAAGRVGEYHEKRDFPGINGTSLLSPYLAAGVLSPRQCLAALTGGQKKWPAEGSGAWVWLSELVWRDFYAHVLVGFPRVSRGQPFKLQTKALQWNHDSEKLEKWQNGQTGFPIVDAAMRQLRQTGWMHNRLRMIAAMFLSKYPFIDWRLGEKFFMQHLLDGDLAANNGGWQWSASTGTDAVPYFRIFNPFSQSARFDPDGAFIRKFCPELAEVPTPALHDPKKLAVAVKSMKIDYPPLLVDPQKARQQVMMAFKAIGQV